MIQESGNRLSLATSAERVCAEIMLMTKRRDHDPIKSNRIMVNGKKTAGTAAFFKLVNQRVK